MSDTPEEPRLPPSLRLLKGLVIVLTITMIVGVITVVGLLVTRMPKPASTAPALPPALQMPAGAVAEAVTMAPGWIAVVTQDNRILIFAADGKLLQEIAVALPPG